MSSDNPDKPTLRIVTGQAVVSDSRDAGALAPTSVNAVCPICFGTGTELKGAKGAVLCECRRTNRKANLLKASRIPQRFQGRSFGNYYPKNESQEFALKFAKTIVELYPGADKGLLLMGGVGVGKTHLAIAILRELIEQKGVNCLFYESGSLLKAIQESYSSISETSEMRVLAPVYEAEVLVLDELGAIVPTDWVRDTLYQIINTRYNNSRLTLFTTNFADELHVDEELRTLRARLTELGKGGYDSQRASEIKEIEKRSNALRGTPRLEDRIGVTLRSRLYEMCAKLQITGQDFRRNL